MQNLPFHPHYDVWALIFSLIIFFEYSTNNKAIKQEKRKVWYSGVGFLWLFTDYPIHDIGEKYLFSVHSSEHLVLALVSPPLLLLGIDRFVSDFLLSITVGENIMFMSTWPKTSLLTLPPL